MDKSETRQALPFFLDSDRLADLSRTHRDAYGRAHPFPHVVFDDFLPEAVLDDVLREFPAPGDVPWWTFDSDKERKLASRDESIMGPVTRQLLAQLNSSTFVTFLQELTGIAGLVPDPHYHGGGLHQIEPGGFLKVHADFNLHPVLRLERRLNLLVYLNRDWDESYGGHLELWDHAAGTCRARILPVFNRCVLFSTSDRSFHGHPDPLRCPEGMTRKSLALYYYTASDGPLSEHNTLFLGETEERQPPATSRAKRLAQQVVPPAVLNAARRGRRLVRERGSRSGAASAAATASSEASGTSDVDSMFSWARARAGSRPEYLWSVLQAARSASNLGIDRISVVEFGVAGGNGLLALEAAAETAESLLGVGIDVVGFDAGSGMPEPKDHRDAGWAIQAGYFEMDVDALRARLRRAQLVIGPVGDTVGGWLGEEHPPVGFISVDLDYYSSTVDALSLLAGPAARLLPRIVCYFDDILGYTWTDFMGERAAVAEFNEANERRKIGQIHGLRYLIPRSEFNVAWPEKVYLAQLFDHELYNVHEGRPAEHWFESLRLAPPDQST